MFFKTNILYKYLILLGCFLGASQLYAKLDSPSYSDASLNKSSPPEIILAGATAADPWFGYVTRPTTEEAENNPVYSKDIRARNQQYKKLPPNYYVPWTYIGPEEGQKKLQVLRDTVPDRLIDSKTGKRYVALYHGTTSDALEIFRQGVKEIRFDVATNKVLGMGFYLSASLNEAKFYACLRLGQRKRGKPNIRVTRAQTDFRFL
jgi:hypothetical protein